MGSPQSLQIITVVLHSAAVNWVSTHRCRAARNSRLHTPRPATKPAAAARPPPPSLRPNRRVLDGGAISSEACYLYHGSLAAGGEEALERARVQACGAL